MKYNYLNELDLKIKDEEKSEELIAMEIENLKSINMIEMQRIEDLKQDIEKTKSLKSYLEKDINDLEEKLSYCENENKQTEIEYEIIKNELEDKLKKLKQEIKTENIKNTDEKEKYKEVIYYLNRLKMI